MTEASPHISRKPTAQMIWALAAAGSASHWSAGPPAAEMSAKGRGQRRRMAVLDLTSDRREWSAGSAGEKARAETERDARMGWGVGGGTPCPAPVKFDLWLMTIYLQQRFIR